MAAISNIGTLGRDGLFFPDCGRRPAKRTAIILPNAISAQSFAQSFCRVQRRNYGVVNNDKYVDYVQLIARCRNEQPDPDKFDIYNEKHLLRAHHTIRLLSRYSYDWIFLYYERYEEYKAYVSNVSTSTSTLRDLNTGSLVSYYIQLNRRMRHGIITQARNELLDQFFDEFMEG